MHVCGSWPEFFVLYKQCTLKGCVKQIDKPYGISILNSRHFESWKLNFQSVGQDKVQIFWEGHTNLKKHSSKCWRYQVMLERNGSFFNFFGLLPIFELYHYNTICLKPEPFFQIEFFLPPQFQRVPFHAWDGTSLRLDEGKLLSSSRSVA